MKYLIWDFDGTLAYRQGGLWSAALLEILHQENPACHVSIEQLRPFLQTGFPWHTPQCPHPEIQTTEQWWNALDGIFEKAFLGVGIQPEQAKELAKKVRLVYPNPLSWRLYEDVLPALEQLSDQGWTHLVLSNHVPELRQIIQSLPLSKYIAHVFNSAETGYEKPHRQACESVLTTLRGCLIIRWYIVTMKRKAYPTDLSDEQWAQLSPYLPKVEGPGAPRRVNLREILNAIFYLSHTGCQWRMLPHDLPPWETVYYYFSHWRDDGTLERLNRELRIKIRLSAGKDAEPSAAIMDSQTVKTTETSGGAATMRVRRSTALSAMWWSTRWECSWW